MRDFLFRFGYCNPAQWSANEAHGWDDESSGAFYIRAETEDEALSWGQEVANRFVMHQFQRAGVEPGTSWREANFANWIDRSPEKEFTQEQLQSLPHVELGMMPTFDDWA